jgi:MerR family transcriptional regulator, copper efflux regulator
MLINEIAKMAGLSKDGIRHYEALGLIGSVPRKAGSRTYRDYDPSVLDTIGKIRDAQRLGLSLKEICLLLKIYVEIPPSREEAIAFLEARLVVIHEKIAALRDVEEFICGKLDRFRRMPPHELIDVTRP